MCEILTLLVPCEKISVIVVFLC
uniref:Uncharacterized protein n=1 Tax=Rhizophora mucronata TaxID=61149 RepID=A0A2P2QH91_RHIMU